MRKLPYSLSESPRKLKSYTISYGNVLYHKVYGNALYHKLYGFIPRIDAINLNFFFLFIRMRTPVKLPTE